MSRITPLSAARRRRVGWKALGTPGMGTNLWGESPLWVNQHRIWSRIRPPMITTSLRQVQSREGLCGGSLTAKVRADGQKSHTRPSLVGE